MEIAGLAEQLAPQVDHWLDVGETELGSHPDAPLEGLVLVADVLEIDSDVDLAHGILPAVRLGIGESAGSWETHAEREKFLARTD